MSTLFIRKLSSWSFLDEIHAAESLDSMSMVPTKHKQGLGSSNLMRFISTDTVTASTRVLKSWEPNTVYNISSEFQDYNEVLELLQTTYGRWKISLKKILGAMKVTRKEGQRENYV